jgi:Holliday junction resolvase RusA-like endonuclease
MERWMRGLGFPPSVNHFYNYRAVGKKVIPSKTDKYKAYAAECSVRMLNQRFHLPNRPHAFYAYLFAPTSFWFTKSGKAQRVDLDNFLKAGIDTICARLSFDDRWIFEIHAFKCISPNKRMDVCFSDKLATKVFVE